MGDFPSQIKVLTLPNHLGGVDCLEIIVKKISFSTYSAKVKQVHKLLSSGVACGWDELIHRLCEAQYTSCFRYTELLCKRMLHGQVLHAGHNSLYHLNLALNMGRRGLFLQLA